MTHEEAEIAIGMRQHGALDVAGCAALDDHLSSCASCRKFEQATATQETEMQAHTINELSQVNWTHVEARLSRLRAENRNLVPRAAAMLAALVVVAAWVYDAETAIMTAGLGAGIFALLAVMVRRRRREVARAAESDGELLAFYRAHVAGALRRTRTARWFLPAMAAVWLGTGIAAAITGHPVKDVAYQLAMGVFTAGWSVQTWRDHARLRRERAELV